MDLESWGWRFSGGVGSAKQYLESSLTQPNWYVLPVCNEHGKLIGYGDLHVDPSIKTAEIGMLIGKEHQCHGHGTRLVKQLIGFDQLSLDRITAIPQGPGAIRMAHKEGVALSGQDSLLTLTRTTYLKDKKLSEAMAEMIKSLW